PARSPGRHAYRPFPAPTRSPVSHVTLWGTIGSGRGPTTESTPGTRATRHTPAGARRPDAVPRPHRVARRTPRRIEDETHDRERWEQGGIGTDQRAGAPGRSGLLPGGLGPGGDPGVDGLPGRAPSGGRSRTCPVPDAPTPRACVQAARAAAAHHVDRLRQLDPHPARAGVPR